MPVCNLSSHSWNPMGYMYKGHTFDWLCNASTHLASSFVIKLQSNGGCMRHLGLIMCGILTAITNWFNGVLSSIAWLMDFVEWCALVFLYISLFTSLGGWPTGQYRQSCTNSPWPFPRCHQNLWHPFTGPWGSWWQEYRCCCLDDPTPWSQLILLLVGAINSKLLHWKALGRHWYVSTLCIIGRLFLSVSRTSICLI